MRRDHALGVLMAQRRLLLLGNGVVAEALERRLARLEVSVVHEEALATDAIFTWEPAPRTPGDLGAQIQQLTKSLDTGGLRRVVLLLSDEAPVATAIAKTLTLYAAAHLVRKKTRFNMVRLASSPSVSALEPAINATLMLMSGRMDAVHGQVLNILANGPEAHA